MIIGIGTDVVQIPRITRLLKTYGHRFIERIFTPEEQKAGQVLQGKVCDAYYAKRFAGKEAMVKALGIGFREGITYRDIEVTNFKSGQPKISVRAQAKKRLEKITPNGMVPHIAVTITDDYPIAQAFVIISAVQRNKKIKEDSCGKK